MKKIIFLLSIIFAILFSMSCVTDVKTVRYGATLLVSWNNETGVLRAPVTNFQGLLLQTNAYKYDYYFVANPKSVSNEKAGLWQCKVNSPRYATNWKLIVEMIGTNFVHSFPGNNSAWSNVVMTAYTQAFHAVMTAQWGALSNTSHTVITNVAKTFTRTLTGYTNTATNMRARINTNANQLIVGTNTLDTNLRVRINVVDTNWRVRCNMVDTNWRVRADTNANRVATNQHCWAEIWQTNASIGVATFTPATNSRNSGICHTSITDFTAYTNIAGSLCSTPTTNYIGYISATRQIRIGSAGLGTYEISYSVQFDLSSATATNNYIVKIGRAHV